MEKIYIKLKNDEGLGEYKVHKDTENLYYNSISDLISLIDNKDYIENISIKEFICTIGRDNKNLVS